MNTFFSSVPVDNGFGQALLRATRDAIWPFRYDHADTYHDYDLDFHEYRIITSVFLKSGQRLEHIEKIARDDVLDDSGQAYSRVINATFWAFRNRPSDPIPSIITLGDQ